MLSFSQEDLRLLAGHGLKVHGLVHTLRLAPGSSVEWPTSVMAKVTQGAFLEVGAFSNLSGGSLNNIRVGRYCSIAHGAVTGSHEHPTNWLTTSRTAYVPHVNGWDKLLRGEVAQELRHIKRPYADSCPNTTLGHDVWIGQDAYIKAGVTIGHGAIVGARATVVKDVPPYAIVAGTPAKVLRYRFSDEIIARLLALKWWDYCIYDFYGAPLDDIERALDVMEDLIDQHKVQPFGGVRLGPETLASVEGILAALPDLLDAGPDR